MHQGHGNIIFEFGIHHISRPLLGIFTTDAVHSKMAVIHNNRKSMMDFDSHMTCTVYAHDGMPQLSDIMGIIHSGNSKSLISCDTEAATQKQSDRMNINVPLIS